MKLVSLTSGLALLVTFVSAAATTTTTTTNEIRSANDDIGTPTLNVPAGTPPADQRLKRIIRRDEGGLPETHNLAPCRTKCKDSEILNCSSAEYDEGGGKSFHETHTWHCFCSDGTICMGATRGQRGEHTEPHEVDGSFGIA